MGGTGPSGNLPDYTEGLKDPVICLRSQTQAGLHAPRDSHQAKLPCHQGGPQNSPCPEMVLPTIGALRYCQVPWVPRGYSLRALRSPQPQTLLSHISSGAL